MVVDKIVGQVGEPCMQYEIWGILLMLVALGYFLDRRFKRIEERISKLEGGGDDDWPS